MHGGGDTDERPGAQPAGQHGQGGRDERRVEREDGQRLSVPRRGHDTQEVVEEPLPERLNVEVAGPGVGELHPRVVADQQLEVLGLVGDDRVGGGVATFGHDRGEQRSAVEQQQRVERPEPDREHHPRIRTPAGLGLRHPRTRALVGSRVGCLIGLQGQRSRSPFGPSSAVIRSNRMWTPTLAVPGRGYRRRAHAGGFADDELRNEDHGGLRSLRSRPAVPTNGRVAGRGQPPAGRTVLK